MIVCHVLMDIDPKVSVIIPSYNRFNCLLDAIRSVREQSYKNIEIIVVDDCSTDKRYRKYKFGDDVKVIYAKTNSKKIYGFPFPPRNEGMRIASGKYMAFLDDDDYWLPDKIKMQVCVLEGSRNRMCCTEGFGGKGRYDKNKTYRRFSQDIFWPLLSKKLGLVDDFPNIFTKELINKHNVIITSSVMVRRDLVKEIGYFKPCRSEDKFYWLRCLERTNCDFIQTPLMYYDGSHGKL